MNHLSFLHFPSGFLSPEATLTRLRQQSFLVLAVSLLSLSAGFLLLGAAWDWQIALHWGLISLSVNIYLFSQLVRRLDLNHRAGETALLPGLGPGNLLSIARAVLLAHLAGFLVLPRPAGWLLWLPAALYTLAALLDLLDGYAARRANHATDLGEFLDMLFDSWGMLLATTLLVIYQKAPPWYLLIGLARYLFLAGLALRDRLGLPNLPLPPSNTRRLNAGLQMGLTFVLLWPPITPATASYAAIFFSTPFLIFFLKDWLTVSGTLKPEAKRWAGGPRRAALHHWLPLALRLLAAALGAALSLPVVFAPGSQPTPYPWLLLASLGLLLGVAPRLMAILAALLLGLLPAAPPLTLLLLALSAILYLGPGPFALWQPEGRWFAARQG